jgi:hypothetical protein
MFKTNVKLVFIVSALLMIWAFSGCCQTPDCQSCPVASSDPVQPSNAPGLSSMPVYNVKDFGAFDITGISHKETGKWTPKNNPEKFSHFAINKAIKIANKAGGGKVYVPAGTWLIGSIEMKSYVTLHLENGCVLQAAKNGINAYTRWEQEVGNKMFETEDFGRVHWKPTVLWAINERHMTIEGDGIFRSWTKGYGGITNSGKDTGRPDPFDKTKDHTMYLSQFPQGDADKTIAMKECSDIVIKGITILSGGHFGMIFSGCHNGVIENVLLDTNRDGMNLDCCRNFKVKGCTVNSICDDGICIKSPSSLGYQQPSENITISDCTLSGYDTGSVYNKTYTLNFWPIKETGVPYPKHFGTGRIKLGTESAGGFKNITVTNCVFDNSRGFCIEEVDGGILENITFSNIVMKNCTNSPIFIRLGGRQRTVVENAPIGKIRNITIDNITVIENEYTSRNYSSLILGHDKDNPAENITISNYRLITAGGGTKDFRSNIVPLNDLMWYPKMDKDGNFIEDEDGERIPVGTGENYPEPHNFCSDKNPSPTYGFYVRFVKNITFNNVMMETTAPDARDSIIFDTVDEILLRDVFERNTVEKKTASKTYVNCKNILDKDI